MSIGYIPLTVLSSKGTGYPWIVSAFGWQSPSSLGWSVLNFDNFILGRKGKVIKVHNVIRWIKKYSPLPINKYLEYTSDLEDKVPGLVDAVSEYLHSLCKLGFLHKDNFTRGFYSAFTVIYDKLSLPTQENSPQITQAPTNSTAPMRKNINLNSLSIYNKKGKCRMCNEITDSWTIFYGEDQTCICRECNDKR